MIVLMHISCAYFTVMPAWQDLKTLHAQVCMDFPEAHPQRKVTKKWLHGKLKDIAEREKGQWVIKPEALAEAGKPPLQPAQLVNSHRTLWYAVFA